MKVKESTIQQVKRALTKAAAKFPKVEEPSLVTDIHIQVIPESGELMVFNDDDVELTRCVVEEWIGSNQEDFYEQVAPVIRDCIVALKDTLENISILKPYSFELIDDARHSVTDLYLVDDDTMIVGDELLKGLDKELDDFINRLMKES